ncbi:MAG TPA: pseudouridine synthase, partial [Gemmataceae bacterium]
MSVRFFIVGKAETGRPVGDCLRARLSLPRSAVRRLLTAQQVRVNGTPCTDPHRRLQRGQRVQVRLPKSPKDGARNRDRKGAEERTPLPHGRGSAQKLPFGDRLSKKGPRPTIRYADEHLVIVDKPAGLTTMRHAEDVAAFGRRAKRFLPPTLADLLPDLLARRSPGRKITVRAVHRLDKETSGLVVFARTVEAERHLGRQFRAHTIERQYLAVVR